MKHLPRSRCLSRGLSACTAAILVAGCGGSPLVAPLSGIPALPSLDRNASGGASQSYIGAWQHPALPVLLHTSMQFPLPGGEPAELQRVT